VHAATPFDQVAMKLVGHEFRVSR